MCFLFNLSQYVVLPVFCDWLGIEELCRLDSANCNKVDRISFLDNIEHESVKFTGLGDLEAFETYLKWIVRRNLCISNLNIKCHVVFGALTKKMSLFNKLKVLNMENDTEAIKAPFLNLIKTCKVLEFLHVQNCKFVDDPVISMVGESCKHLTTFSMPCNSGPNSFVTDKSIAHMAKQCKFLEVLYLGNFVSVTGSSFHAIAKYSTQLRELTICNLDKVTDSALFSITKCPQLTELYVCGSSLVTVRFVGRVLLNCAVLREFIVLGGANIYCDQSDWVVNSTNLTQFRIESIEISDKTLDHITSRCVNLRDLMLSGGKNYILSSIGAVHIANNCHSLEVLVLTGYMYSFSVLEDVLDVVVRACGPTLTSLEISHCYCAHFLGNSNLNVLVHCAKLTSLTLAHLEYFVLGVASFRNITAYCKQLKTLDLSRNSLVDSNGHWSEILELLQNHGDLNEVYLLKSQHVNKTDKDGFKQLRESIKPRVFLKAE